MITNKDIHKIFHNYLPKNKPIAIGEIMKFIENNYSLTKEDWKPNPAEIERGSSYPSWKRKVQAALHTLKLQGKIQHFEKTREYIF